MVGSSFREGNLFGLETASPTSSFGTTVSSAGLTAARWISDLYQSNANIDPLAMSYALDALYPVKDYVKQAANLNMYFSQVLHGRTYSPTNATLAQMLLGDLMFTCSGELTSSVISTIGTRNAYLYLFNHTPSNPVLALLGPTHTSEMPYVFGTFNEYAAESTGGTSTWKPTALEQTLSTQIMDYWLDFARYLTPNGPGSEAPVWPHARCGESNDFMVFGNNGSGERVWTAQIVWGCAVSM